MQEPTRLFDILERRKQHYPNRPVFGHKHQGTWQHISIEEYITHANNISYGLIQLGVKKGENIALISSGRPEWNYIDMGVQQIGATLVPIYPTISEEDYLYILNNTEVQYIFVENCIVLKKINAIREHLTHLKTIYTLKTIEGETYINELYDLGAAQHEGEKLQLIKAGISGDDVATIIYTSGTTGTPKGVMLSHKGIIANILGIKDSPEKDWTRALSWMPMCHIYERMMNYLYQYLGMETFYAESIGKVAENCQEVNPHIMAAVPRFIEKMYDKIYRKGEKLKGLKKHIFDWALELGFEYDLNPRHRNIGYEMQRLIADRLVYKTIRESLGKNFHMLVSGGASIQPRLTRFFSCVGLDLYEGYGLTECSPLIAVTNAYAPEGRKVGSVGLILPGTEVKFDPDTHEIHCRGPQVMKGYFKAPELTAEAIDADGWFHTGDTGYLDNGGHLFLTGRTKNMFKTSMGKFVNPEVIEEKFKESPFILDMMVVGEGEKFAAAIIAPDFEMLKGWSHRHGVSVTAPEDLVVDKIVLARYQRVMDKYNAQLGNTEQIKRFLLVTDTWSTDNKFLTPTLKIRRKAISEYYKDDIQKLFA